MVTSLLRRSTARLLAFSLGAVVTTARASCTGSPFELQFCRMTAGMVTVFRHSSTKMTKKKQKMPKKMQKKTRP